MNPIHRMLSAICVAAGLFAGGCGGGDGGGGGTGQLTLHITDAPVDEAERVVVQFTGVEIKARAEGAAEVFDFATPRQIDLLALEGGGSETLLEDVELPAGDYEWIRLKVSAGLDASDSFIDLEDGSRHALFIPSANETGLKLVSGFTIGVGSSVDFTIDFDLRKSVIAPPGLAGSYILKPALRLVDNLKVGTIEGEVAAALAQASGCEPAVYAFTGAGVTPNDLGSSSGPIASGRVQMDTNGAFRFRIGFVPAGEYTVSFTCDDDDPEVDETTVEFVDTQNVTVSAGATSSVRFE